MTPEATVPRLADFRIVQEDAAEPEVICASEASGERSLGLFRFRSASATTISGVPSCDHIFVNVGATVKVWCRVGQDESTHVLRPGHFAVCPTGYESRCETTAGCDAVILAVPKEALAYAFAERAQPRTGLVSRLSAKDLQLSGLARRLVLEAVKGRSMSAHGVSRLQEKLFELLSERYARSREGEQPGGFTPQVLDRINQYIRKHLSEPIDVHDVAGMVGQSRSHFSRVFRQSVGLSPHQYIVLVRLECAVRHMRSAELSLAEIASATGFYDQSHLTHWTRRVYGTSPGQIAKASRHADPDEPRAVHRRSGG